MSRIAVLLITCLSLTGCGMLDKLRDTGAETETAAETADAAVTVTEATEGEPRPTPRPGSAEETQPEAASLAAEKPTHDPNAVARAKCIAQGGKFQKAGASGARACVTPTRDANKSCSASSQCEGLCLARSGTCAPIAPLFGCHDIVTNDGNMATVCID